MAGDWIRMRVELPDDPDVIAIAAAVGIDEDAVVGKLLRFWGWASAHTTDGNAPGVTSAFLDRYLRAPGFADALRGVGWLEITDRGLAVPDFDRYLSEGAKVRALTAQRVARCKIKKLRSGNAEGNAPTVTKALPREEKRRVNTSKLRFEVIDREEADRQWAAIQQVNPTQKAPDLDAWANTIRLMRERDKRSIEEIRCLFDWAHAHDFWGGVILSPANLRKHWDKMQAQRATRGTRNAKQDRGRYRGGDQPHVKSIQV